MFAQISTFQCFICSREFFAAKTLINHIKYSHPFLSKYECSQKNCGRTYRDLQGLRKHFVTHHVEENFTKQLNVANLHTTENKSIYSSLPSNTSIGNNETSSNVNLPRKDCLTIGTIVAQFVAKLYGDSSLNRGIVQLVMTHTNELIDSIFTYIRNNLESNSVDDTLHQVIADVTQTFQKLGTDYRRLQYFKDKKMFIKPANFPIGTADCLTRTNTPNHPQMSIKIVNGQKISMLETLNAFLNLPNVFEKMKHFVNTEENACSNYTSVFQGKLWKSIKPLFEGKTVFPILLFFDDFEIINPLGSRAGNYKIGGVYMSLASVPPEYSSLLENTFLVQLFYSSDRTTYGNKRIFQNLINDLIYLETTGLSVNINDKMEKVYFVLLLVLGDNLGLNSVLGFNESFNSEYFCRICIAPKYVTQTEIDDSKFILRTLENYAQDSENCTRGVKEKCIWHALPNFHISRNFSCDLMHDCFEGILRYDMAFIISSLLDQKYFDLNHLNNRIKFFKFSKADAGNAMPQIKSDHLKKKQLIMSASEMLALTVYFGLLIGDLVPPTEQIWSFYILILQIIDILLQRHFSDHLIEYLQTLIREHHRLFQDLFNEPLKPKYHFLLHYPHIIMNIGPPRFYWCIRYEAFHRLLKRTAYTVTCRRNLLVTLSIKQQLRLSSRIMSNTGFHKIVQYGPTSKLDKKILTNLNLPQNSVSVSWIIVNSILYKKDFVLQLEETEFVQIKDICTDKADIYFVLKRLPFIGFCEHLQAFEILVSEIKENIFVMPFDNITSRQVFNIHFSGNGKSFISTIK